MSSQLKCEPFVFRDGQRAFTPEELVTLCESQQPDGIYFLLREDLEKWLQYIGREELAEIAMQARLAPDTDEERLRKFMIDCNRAFNNPEAVSTDLAESQQTPVTEAKPDSAETEQTPVTEVKPDLAETEQTPVTEVKPDLAETEQTPVTEAKPDLAETEQTPVTEKTPAKGGFKGLIDKIVSIFRGT